MARTRIPYGISNFESLIKENYYFVDKTKYIELLENLNEKHIIFLRPRRFGKSLFVSILEYYYDINYKGNNLFEEFYIGRNPTTLRNSYYILTFSFSGIDTSNAENTKRGFNYTVYNSVLSFIMRYNLDIDIDENKSANELLGYFFMKVSELISGKLYILIDEYDHFANEILGFNYEFFKDSVEKNGFVRKFYETIKEGTRIGIVDRLFITGVTPITLDSLTSGFNIGSNITVNEKYNEMLGFTEEEVRKLIKITLPKYDIEENIEKLRNYYNGYKFNEEASSRIYNSDMVLYYVSNYQYLGKEPKEIVDINVVSDYRKIANLFNIGGGLTEAKMNVLKNITKGEDEILNLTRSYNLSKGFGLDDFRSLLFYMGFLTIRDIDIAGRTHAKSPNYVIKELYFEYFEQLMEEKTGYNIETDDIINAIADMAINGKIDSLVKLTEEVLKRLSGRDFIQFDEKYIKVIMLMFLYRSNLYYVKSEYEVEGGYVDILLKKGTVGNPRYFGMVELKYIKKKEYEKRGETVIKEKLADGKKQIERYADTEEVRNLGNVKKWVLVYVGEECKLIEDIK